MKTLSIYGAGGHAKVVLDALKRTQVNFEVVLLDDKPMLATQHLLGVKILTKLNAPTDYMHVAIGNNQVRQSLSRKRPPHQGLLTIIHPLASISPYATVGDGCFIAAFSILAPDCKIGESTIINHGAIVDHDVIVGSFTHIAPNVTLGGKVVVGDDVLIGAGAIILPGIHVGNGATVGAGAVVVRDVLENTTVIGVPAG